MAQHATRVFSALSWRIRRPWDWARYRATRLPVTPLVGPAKPMPTVGLFRDIPVVAQVHAYNHSVPGEANCMASGPVYPEGQTEPWMRHCIYQSAHDVVPARPDGPMERISRPSVWLGYMHMQFGHLVTEHLTRALWSRTSRPDDLYLFVLAPGTRLGWPHYHFLDLLAWYGLPMAQLRQVTKPVLVSELRVYPQSELLMGAGPAGEYLDLLDRHVAASGLKPRKSDLLFVTRAGMLARRTGSHAGENLLRDILKQSGVTVINPTDMPLRDQLSAYAGAAKIVFSEGSALHGRQLLGRLDQDLIVLNRRVGARTGMSALAPRARSLTYIEASRSLAIPLAPWGEPRTGDALSFYDLDVVFDCFDKLGVSLRSRWDRHAYTRAVESDINLWVRQLATAGRGYDPATLEALAQTAWAKAGGNGK